MNRQNKLEMLAYAAATLRTKTRTEKDNGQYVYADPRDEKINQAIRFTLIGYGMTPAEFDQMIPAIGGSHVDVTDNTPKPTKAKAKSKAKPKSESSAPKVRAKGKGKRTSAKTQAAEGFAVNPNA